MQVWNVLHAAHWIYRTQKNCQKFAICAPSHKFVGLYLRNQGIYRQPERNLLNSNIPPHVLTYGELRPISGWDRFSSLGHPSKFQWVSCVGFVTAPKSLNAGQPYLHDVWPSPALVHCIYTFSGQLPPNGILPVNTGSVYRALGMSEPVMLRLNRVIGNGAYCSNLQNTHFKLHTATTMPFYS